MSAGRTPSVPETDAPGFEVERFEWAAPDRLEVSGRWFGVRGRRFVRPTLEVRGASVRRPLLALLEHKPWAPLEGEPWIAAFAWDGDPVAFEGAELAVAPDIAVALEAPTAAKGVRLRRAGAERPRGTPAKARRFHRKSEAGGDAVLAAGATRDGGTAEAALQQVDELRRERDAALRSRDTLRRELDVAIDARDAALRERDALLGERDALTASRDAALEERDAAVKERDALAAERETLAAEREALAGKRGAAEREVRARVDELLAETRRQLEAERDAALATREAAVAARDAAIEQRDLARQERNELLSHPPETGGADAPPSDAAVRAALAERDAARRERDGAVAERDRAVAARDRAVAARDAAVAEREALAGERQAGVADRAEAVRERDAAVRERDAARAARRELAHAPGTAAAGTDGDAPVDWTYRGLAIAALVLALLLVAAFVSAVF